jgi:hypothetical protein
MPNVLASYIQGQQAVENNKRNRLLDMQLQNAPAEQQRANKLADLQVNRQQQAYDITAQEQQKAQEVEVLKRAIAGAQYVAQSKSPKLEAEQRYPDFVRQYKTGGGNWDELDDEGVRGMAGHLLEQLSAQAGIGPEKKFAREDGPRGSVLQKDPLTGELKQIVGPDNSQPTTPTRGRYRALTPQEIAATGLPAGSSAQLDVETGKIDVLSKKDTTGSLSQKDSTVAKIKLNQLKVAKQQIANARERFDKIKDTLEAGPGGQGLAPSELGRQFDKSIDQLRGSITAITRVPGVGSMSDYESKLDQGKFPSRREYESVTEQQLNDLEQQLSTIEGGYKELLGSPAQSQQAPQSAGVAPQGIVKVASRAEALKLPPGTRFQAPDGRVITRR